MLASPLKTSTNRQDHSYSSPTSNKKSSYTFTGENVSSPSPLSKKAPLTKVKDSPLKQQDKCLGHQIEIIPGKQ